MIEFKTPKPEQVEMMKEFAQAIEAAFIIIEKYEPNNIVGHVFNKMQEAMHWFQSGLLNDVMSLKQAVEVCIDPNCEQEKAPE